MDGTSQRKREPPPLHARGELMVGVARHLRYRFPARTESVRARYDRDELAVVAAAAARAGMTASGYVAAKALAVASGSRPPLAGTACRSSPANREADASSSIALPKRLS